jgi:3-dehydroquinate synthase
MAAMFDLEVQHPAELTRVTVKLNVCAEVGELLRTLIGDGRRLQAVVITDERVGELYGEVLLESLGGASFVTYEHRLVPGEASKRLAVADTVYRFLADHGIGRDAVLIALGGGVVSDLAGFVAATWMRGIRLAICPTTLEADIDACFGGKTAVNVPGGKNLVGVFHQPVLVAVDPMCLRTLDSRDVRAGLAESVKHALISSESFFAWHEDNGKAVVSLDEELITELILRNLRVKASIVEKDALERTHTRMLLNFGHTIGHAIEACCEFELRHGECVSLGMLAACRLSVALGLLKESAVTRVEALLKQFGLPTRLADRIEAGPILDTIRNDKKVRGGAPQFVLLENIGRPVVRDDVAESRIREAYESLLA